jgi:hypothetical protein
VSWSTSPRASSVHWTPEFSKFQADRLGDQFPSIKCSVVGAVLQIRVNRLGDQFPSIKCSVVDAVPRLLTLCHICLLIFEKIFPVKVDVTRPPDGVSDGCMKSCAWQLCGHPLHGLRKGTINWYENSTALTVDNH